MIYLIIASIFLVPLAGIITIPHKVFWYPSFLAMEFIGGVAIASQFWKINKSLSVVIGYLVFTCLILNRGDLIQQLTLFFGLTVLFITLAVSKIKNTKPIYTAIMIVAALNIFYCVLQLFHIDPQFTHHKNTYDIVGFMGSRNQLGAFLCATAFLSVPIAALSLIPFFLSNIFSGFFGFLAGLIVYFWKKDNRYSKILIALFIIVTVLLLIHPSGKLQERLDLWQLTVTQVTEGKAVINMPRYTDWPSQNYIAPYAREIHCNPLFGFGLGNFNKFSPMTQLDILYNHKHNLPLGNYYEHAHNDLAEWHYEEGWLGLIVMLFVIGEVAWTFWRAIKTPMVIATFSSLVAQSVCSCGVYVFHSPVSFFMFCLTLGLFYAEVNRNK